MGGTLFVAVAGFALLVAVVALAARPFLTPMTGAPKGKGNGLADEKERTLEEIRELDLDFATGKVSEEDYRELRAQSLAEATEALRALDSAAAAGAAESSTRPEDATRHPEPEEADELEQVIAAKRAAMQARKCPVCGAGHSARARYCEDCGSELPPVEAEES